VSKYQEWERERGIISEIIMRPFLQLLKVNTASIFFSVFPGEIWLLLIKRIDLYNKSSCLKAGQAV
jgi:hypothetical protein